MSSIEFLALLAAVGHPQRLRIIAALAERRMYISELARRLGMSRPLLYMHLDRLEKVGLVEGSLDLSEDGRALRYFELVEFELDVDVETILAAVRSDEEQGAAEPASKDEEPPPGP
ncbi:winged helix-turn-helix domain-containing protein [Kitasatospora sp. NPDC002551]|uniref:ArsR/SmtB family transcription factor n=1 Tax=Kitasatospora sp. NPDC002551 TaxID=3154539 RepID=UPI00332F77A5